MERRLRDERLDRRRILVPVLVCMLLVLLGTGITEFRRQQTFEINSIARDRQELLRVLAETIYAALESESAQRGYLLTGEARFREPFESSVIAAEAGIRDLTERLRRLEPGDLPEMEQVRSDYAGKVEEMRESIRLLEDGRNVEALRLVKQGGGLQYMRSIRDQLEQLRTVQRASVYRDIEQVNAMVRLNRLINIAMSSFTLMVLLLAGLLASRDLRRRQVYSTELRRRVADATYQIRDLTRHMARISEVEKHALARELHDELGGLLVSLRMDIAQIRKRLPLTDSPDLEMRWKRVDQALGAGIDLKRRVIEELRPTLLDNMGLYTALRWQTEQTCSQAGLVAIVDIPEQDRAFAPDVAIAVFRVFQEALTNVAKHANATHVWVVVTFASGRLGIRVEDDGVGVMEDAELRSEVHGVRQMRFRIESLGGTFMLQRREPQGTVVEITIPEQAPAVA